MLKKTNQNILFFIIKINYNIDGTKDITDINKNTLS